MEYGLTGYSHSDLDTLLKQFIDHSQPGWANYLFLRRGMETRKQHGRVRKYLQEQSGWYWSPSYWGGTKYRLTARWGSTGSRWALLTAHARNYSKICFNTDCQTLLTVITSKAPPADLYGIIQDIDQLSLLFISVSFKYVAWLSNSAADQLAKTALCPGISSLSSSGVWAFNQKLCFVLKKRVK